MEGRCTATARSGARCKRYPIPGGTVCRMHGGAAPAVRRKAEERLEEVRLKREVARTLKLGEIADDPRPPHEILRGLMVEASSVVQAVRARVAEMPEDQELASPEAQARMRIWHEWTGLAGRLAEASARVGIAMREQDVMDETAGIAKVRALVELGQADPSAVEAGLVLIDKLTGRAAAASLDEPAQIEAPPASE